MGIRDENMTKPLDLLVAQRELRIVEGMLDQSTQEVLNAFGHDAGLITYNLAPAILRHRRTIGESYDAILMKVNPADFLLNLKDKEVEPLNTARELSLPAPSAVILEGLENNVRSYVLSANPGHFDHLPELVEKAQPYGIPPKDFSRSPIEYFETGTRRDPKQGIILRLNPKSKDQSAVQFAFVEVPFLTQPGGYFLRALEALYAK